MDAVDMTRALAELEQRMQSDMPTTILAVNPEKVMRARADPVLARGLSHATLLIPDGIGVVWALRLLHGVRVRRVTGADLMPELCALAARRGWGVYLLGARAEINEAAARVLAARYPGLHIAGRGDGYFSAAEIDQVIAEINQSGATLLFVAFGSPHQEHWIDRHREQLRVKIIQGVGGSFDVLAGRVARAPAWVRGIHLEWLYRLLRQAALPRFAARVLRQWLKRRLGSAKLS